MRTQLLNHRHGRRFVDVSSERGEGRYLRLPNMLLPVFIIDDCGFVQLNGDQLRDPQEFHEDRQSLKSMLFTSWLQSEYCHEWLADFTPSMLS